MNTPNENYHTPKLPSSKEGKRSLLQKEYDLNIEEQLLVKKRIATLKEKMKLVGKDDPEYGLANMEIDKDLIFLDELISREEELKGILDQS